MAVTLQQIAEAAGVSRGTVDRAMNNRGRINPQVAEKIKKIAEEMGYQPNRAGRMLAMSRRSITIGMLVQATDTPFVQGVLLGAMEAKAEVERMGADVIIKEIPNLDAQRAVRVVDELRDAGCDGIAIFSTDDAELKGRIDDLADHDIPVVTFNSDINQSKRLCFVGQNAEQSGKAAAGLMAEIIEESGQVLVISGYPAFYAHKKRTEGFREELVSCRSDIELLDTQYAFDNDEIAGMITKGMLDGYPNLRGIYLAAAGVEGVCRALEERGMTQKVKVISNDLTDQNIRYLRERKISFLLGQDAYRQGYEPVMILFDKLVDGKDPERELIYTEIEIKTRYNI